MCNVDENGEREPSVVKLKSGLGRKCVKCDQQGVLITRIHDSFCRDCFRVYVVHKFRSAIGKSKLIRDGERVLVAFSGGANSAALLHLIIDGLSERAHKKLRFRPTLIHVDECSVLDISEEERRVVQKNVAEIMKASEFPSYVTSLEQGLQNNLNLLNEGNKFYWEAHADTESLHIPSSSDRNSLKALLSALPTTTSKEDFLRNLRRQLLVAVAKSLGVGKVLSGDCSTRLAVQMLSDISQGRGSQVALDTAFSDARYDDIMVVRPVRDLNAKELSMYNHLCGIDSVTIQSLTTKGYPGASIERLTETFVTGLQADFPSTVSNIVRTSEKLSQAEAQHLSKCTFCQSPLDTDVGPSSALNAIRFSKKLSQFSQHQKELHDASDKTRKSVEETFSHSDYGNTTEEDTLSSSLCFGCQLTLRDFGGDLDILPNFIASRAQHLKDSNSQSARQKMEDQLSEFLIKDDTVS